MGSRRTRAAMASPHWPAAALPALRPGAAATCAFCGAPRVPPSLAHDASIAWVPFAYGRRACADCRDAPAALLEHRRLTRWLTFARTVQQAGLLQRVLTGHTGLRIGRCLFPLVPTLAASRAFLDPGSLMDSDHRCLGSLLPHTQRNSYMRGGGPLHAHPMTHIHPIYADALRSGAPLLVLGDYLKTREGTSTHGSVPVCRAYSAPPDVCHDTLQILGGGAHLATLPPGTYIGPVEEFCVSIRFVTVLVRGYWINVWLRRPARHRGTYLALRVPDAEVASWHALGWMDLA